MVLNVCRTVIARIYSAFVAQVFVPFPSNKLLKTTYHYCKLCNYLIGHVYPLGCGPRGGCFREKSENNTGNARENIC